MKKSILGWMCLAVFALTISLQAQDIQVDLEKIYQIKQIERTSSQIEELSFWMTDYVGPRLTASELKLRANDWAKTRMEEMGLQNVVVEPVRSFDRGGWDNLKTYAAMTEPYYAAFAANPKAWTGSTKGLVKGEVVLIDVKSEEDLAALKGTLKGKIVLMPSTATYEPKFEALATRYTDEELEAMTKEEMGGRRFRGDFDMEAWMRTRRLQEAAGEMMRTEGVLAIVSQGGEFNVPRSSGGNYKMGDKEPIAEISLPI